MPQDRLQKVYNDYSAKYRAPTFEEFSTSMQDDKTRRLVYDDLSRVYTMPSYEEFDTETKPQNGLLSSVGNLASQAYEQGVKQPLQSFNTGFYSAINRLAQIPGNVGRYTAERDPVGKALGWPNFSQALSGVTDPLARFAEKQAAVSAQQGIQGQGLQQDIGRSVYGGVGSAAVDLPVIGATGGLTPFMTATALGDATKDPNASLIDVLQQTGRGAVEGILLEKILAGAGQLPRTASGLPVQSVAAGAATFGGLTAAQGAPLGETIGSAIVGGALSRGHKAPERSILEGIRGIKISPVSEKPPEAEPTQKVDYITPETAQAVNAILQEQDNAYQGANNWKSQPIKELQGFLKDTQTQENVDIESVFGVEGAQRYKALLSQLKQKRYKEKAEEELGKMEAELTEEQQARLFGEEGIPTSSEIKQVIQKKQEELLKKALKQTEQAIIEPEDISKLQDIKSERQKNQDPIYEYSTENSKPLYEMTLQEPTAKQSAGQELSEALNILFFDKSNFNQINSGLGWSEEAYNKAKPHFKEAWRLTKEKGGTFEDFTRDFSAKSGNPKHLGPYIEKFRQDLVVDQRATVTNNQAPVAGEIPDIKWLSGQVFTPLRATATRFRDIGKTNINVNLEQPRAEDLASRVMREEAYVDQISQQEASHMINTKRQLFGALGNISSTAASFAYSHKIKQATFWANAVFRGGQPFRDNSPQAQTKLLRNVPAEFKEPVMQSVAYMRLLDSQVFGNAELGTQSFAQRMRAQGASKGQIDAGMEHLIRARKRVFAAKDVFEGLTQYGLTANKIMHIEPLRVGLAKYMNANEELFPEHLRGVIEQQLDVAGGKVFWMSDKIGQDILGGVRLSQGLSEARRLSANAKLGYRSTAAFIDLWTSITNSVIKRDLKNPYRDLLPSIMDTIRFLKSDAGKNFIEQEKQSGSLGIGLDIDVAGNIMERPSLLRPLGLRRVLEEKQRKFSLAYDYLNQLKQGKTDAEAREHSFRMNVLTNGVYMLSGVRHLMRQPLARTILQYKEFLFRTFEMLHTFSGRQWVEWMGVQLATAGPRGLLLMVKSIPFMAMLGVLDKIEDELNRSKTPLTSGLPGLAGQDIAPQATLQIAPNPDDAGGAVASDIIKLFKAIGIISRTKKYAGAYAAKRLFGSTIEEAIPIVRNISDVIESVVDDNGWVYDQNERPVYQMKDWGDRIAAMMGAQSLERAKVGVARRVEFAENEAKRESVRYLMQALTKTERTEGELDNQALQYLIDLGISSQGIKEGIKSRKLDPATRAALRAKLQDKARALEIYDY